MKTIGIEWFAIRSTAVGTAGPSSACPLGAFRVYFPQSTHPGGSLSPACFHEHPGLDTIGTILEAAQRVGLTVHLGLGYPQYSRIPAGMNSSSYYKTLASINWELAERLWELYGLKYGSILRGWYTDVEESNSRAEMSLMMGTPAQPARTRCSSRARLCVGCLSRV